MRWRTTQFENGYCDSARSSVRLAGAHHQPRRLAHLAGVETFLTASRLPDCSASGMSDPSEDKSGSTGWFLVLIACAVSLIPLFGFAAWFLSGPLLLAAFILSIVSMSRGNGGVGLLLTSAFAAPAFILCAPFISLAVFGAAIGTTAAVASPLLPAAALEKDSPPAPIADTPGVIASKKKLLEIYPEIGIAGSHMNTAYVATVKRARIERPEVFERATWPLIIAQEIAAKNPVSPTPIPKQGDWMKLHGRTSLDRAAY